MLVVSDTSPLSNLAIIGRLDLLQQQFVEVIMPPAVARELRALRDASAQSLLSAAQLDGWLKVIPVPSSAPAPVELAGLDAGETEALRLAMAISADHVLLDEKEGRQRAAWLGVRTVGVLGVLMAAKQAGEVLSLRNEIHALRTNAGFFIDDALEKRVLKMAGE